MPEYITKSQAIDLAESLRPIAGNNITNAFIKGIEGVGAATLERFLSDYVDQHTVTEQEYLERFPEFLQEE